MVPPVRVEKISKPSHMHLFFVSYVSIKIRVVLKLLLLVSFLAGGIPLATLIK